MTSLVSASQVVTGQVQSLDSVRAHALPSDAMIFASGTKVQPANQNLGSYAIVESGVNSLGVTTTGSVPAVTQSPFADLYKEGSVYFNGTAGNYLQNTATYSNSTIAWATTGMTIEAWVNYPTFTGASTLSGTNPQPTLFGMMRFDSGGNYWSFGANTTGYVNFYYYTGSLQTVMSTTQLSANTWNHIAATCSTAGQIFIFVNGVQTTVVTNRSGTLTGTTNFETVQGTPTVLSWPLTMGQMNSVACNAYVADLRLTTGTPVYTGSTGSLATFTVPSAPLSSTTSPGVTQFLLRVGQSSPTTQNGALTFDRGLKQFMNFGPQTFNIATRGFTAVFRYTWNGTVGNYERIFDIGVAGASPSYAYALGFARAGTGNQYYFYVNAPPPASTNPQATTAVGVMNQGTSYVVACRWNPSTGLADIWINGLFNCQSSQTPSPAIADFTSSWTALGTEISKTYWASASANTFAIYNRALSNVEILNAYSALTTATTNAPIEIGDVNGTPALSIAGDGRVNITKMGQSSNVAPWPPAAMTGYVTSINGGTYVASDSSEFNATLFGAWQAFDKNPSYQWSSGQPLYSTSAPYSYTGTVTTTDVNGSVYPGEWLQIQLPSSVTVSSYSIYGASGSNQMPGKWVVLGSRDGVNWFLVDSQKTTILFTVTGFSSFSVNSTQAYSYYRVVTNQISGNSTYQCATILDLVLYGTADTAQPLTIAQPVTLSYGAQTASLTGISGDKYVPQDFSSSGLNVPAYVVSNTATVANTVQYSSFGPFAGEGSLYGGGGSGYGIRTPPSALDYNFGAMDYTFEVWIYITDLSTDSVIFNNGTVSLTISTPGKVRVQMIGMAGAPYLSGTTSVATNGWYHVAATFTSATVRLFTNGVLTDTFSSVTGTPTYTSPQQMYIMANNVLASQFKGYLSNLRIVRGAALYTTNFQVPSGPLQPIQGTTQAGLPYGTVLLRRNAPAPGRVLTSKFGGANSGGVNGAPLTLASPPAAMTGYATTLNAGYGQGTYVASALNEVSATYAAWKAFDKSAGTLWASTGTYNTAANGGVYTASNVTVDVTGTSYNGDWLQVQFPTSIQVSSYSVTARSDSSAHTSPRNWVVLGSSDGINWYLTDARSGYTSWSLGQTLSFTVSASQSFTTYRMVILAIAGTTGVTDTALGDWTLNGTIEGPNVTADGRLGLGVTAPTQALEVAGSAVVAGTLSAGNPLMFRNRILNGDMRIAQRGTSTTSTSSYLVDRFYINSSISTGVITYSQNTLTIADTPYQYGYRNALNLVATTACSSFSYIEPETILEGYSIQDFNWGTSFGVPATLSFWYRSNMPAGSTSNMTIRNTNISTTYIAPFTTTGTWQYLTFTIPPPPSGTVFNTGSSGAIEVMFSPLGNTNGSVGWNASTNTRYSGVYNWAATLNTYIQYTGVQLEKGSVATPFEVVPYGTQLALCQRYYQTVLQAALYRRYMSNIDRQPITFPPMRAAPTGTPVALGTPTNLASISFTSYGVMSGYLDVGYTAAGTGVVDIPSGVNLNLSAEL